MLLGSWLVLPPAVHETWPADSADKTHAAVMPCFLFSYKISPLPYPAHLPFQAVLQAQMWETRVTWFLLAFSVTFNFPTERKGTYYIGYDANATWQIATVWL